MQVGPPLATELDGLLSSSSVRLRIGMAAAIALHGALLVVAYLAPPPPPPRKTQVIAIDLLKPLKPPPREPEAPKPEPEKVTPPTAKTPEPQRADRPPPLPRELLPAKRAPEQETGAKSPAIAVPEPKGPVEPGPGSAKGPINLLPGRFDSIGGTGAVGAVPKGPNRLLEDERLKEKKEPEFTLTPEKGGGYKYEGQRFSAHISPEGVLTFDDRFPIGVQKGGTFTFDLTDLVMKGAKQDPNAAEKRRFAEFSAPVRKQLRTKQTQARSEEAQNSLAAALEELWQSGKPLGVRRRELFEKWAEYADEREATGPAARAALRLIEGFVRRHLPAGSPQGYTDEELRRFAQQRQGQAVFNPYLGGGRGDGAAAERGGGEGAD